METQSVRVGSNVSLWRWPLQLCAFHHSFPYSKLIPPFLKECEIFARYRELNESKTSSPRVLRVMFPQLSVVLLLLRSLGQQVSET